ncbi:hypothetical protein L1987_84582 [Smallanthus sonchifolius]|uniref:Uncharacterized protein n=1 Tax=Smallanthus sonchifolius TaxID=185202 RepID=A0ACB8XTK7_9ASTR|nr:hypothetical protein L1987_84582 [Smallanthus sonchifolius]
MNLVRWILRIRGAEGKFWETNASSEGSGDDEEHKQIKGVTSRKSGPRKGKSKPSSFLDGTLESALRRYSRRSDAGGPTATYQNHHNKKSKDSKKDMRLHAETRSGLDKENDPSRVNFLNDDDMIWKNNQNVVEDHDETYASMHNPDDGCGVNQVLNRELCLDTSLEVNSDQSNKTKTFCSGSDEEGVRITLACMQSLNDVQTLSAWEKWQIHPHKIDWPNVWGATEIVGDDPMGGDMLLTLRTMEVEDVSTEHIKDLCSLYRSHPANNDCGAGGSFFDDNNILLGILHKWGESLQQIRHEDVIEPALGLNSGEVGLDIQSDPEEEIVHKKRKKKNQKGGGKKSKRMIEEEVRQEDHIMDGSNGGMNRKKYKIWSSRNRKPEKNLPLTKHFFRGGSIPPSQQLLGFPEFRVGKEGKRMKGKKDENTKQRQRNPVGEFYTTAAEIEEKLSATVGNINSTDDNRKLLNSQVDNEGFTTVKRKKVGFRGNGQGMRIPLEDHRNIIHRNFVNPGHHGRRRDPGSVQVKDRNIHQSKDNKDQLESYQNKGNGEASNRMEENITGESKQTLHLHTEDTPLVPPERVKTRKPVISVIETSNRFNLLDEEGNTIEENGENNESGNNDAGIPKSLNAGWIKR